MMGETTALEHSTLKVPYELFNKTYRHTQKVIDSELRNFNVASDDLEKCLANPSGSSVPDMVTLLDNVMERLRIMKRKSTDALDEDMAAVRACKIRVSHLRSAETNKPQFELQRMDRMLVDHCFRSGYYNTAHMLAEKAGVEKLTNTELFTMARDIEASLRRKETDLALAWCSENRSRLKKHNSFFEFYLRQQEVIELIKKGRASCMDAILHARKYFPAMEDYRQYAKDIQKTMTLLACTRMPIAGSASNQYQELLSDARWCWLIAEFRKELVKLYQLSPESVFHVVLQTGLSSLKTPACMSKSEKKHPDCPVCHENLNAVAEPLPFAHCSQSRLVCYISGEPLNESNRPMMLPNGYVYGEKALISMVGSNDDITCPRTGSTFKLSECQRVFVM